MAKTEKKRWIVFHTRCGSFVSNRKMTIDDAQTIWLCSSTEKKYGDVFGLDYYENFITGFASSDQWTLKDAQKYAKDEDRKLIDELMTHIENEEEES